jgi:hypothetical protein
MIKESAAERRHAAWSLQNNGLNDLNSAEMIRTILDAHGSMLFKE